MQAAAAASVTDLFLAWLNDRLGTSFSHGAPGSPTIASDGARRLNVFLHPIFPIDASTAWQRRANAVAKQLQQRSPVPLTLWVPPGADFPAGDRSEFVDRITESASALAAGQRGQVEFPVSLSLKRQSDDASYVHVVGGLAPYWARFTGRAYGQYVLDTTAIHRLPEPEPRVADLVEWITLVANGLKSGASTEIKAEDAWTVTRPAQSQETSIICADPGEDPTDGTAVRRAVRAALKACAEVTTEPGTARALVLAGVYRRLEDENATIALRGCDPALYSGLDVVALVADGACKPLIGPLPNSLLSVKS